LFRIKISQFNIDFLNKKDIEFQPANKLEDYLIVGHCIDEGLGMMEWWD
jgi:hypothetical protein